MTMNIASTTEALKKEIKTSVPYSPEEFEYRGYLALRLQSAVNQRAGEPVELNDMDYLTHYEGNAKAANSYNAPKENEEDTRIVTGTTQEKEHTLLSALLNYNLEPNIQAFEDDMLEFVELGEHMEDMVKKSREIEEYDQQRPLIYKELLDQGTVFVEEITVEQICVKKKMRKQDWSKDGVKVDNTKWDKKLKKLYAKCQVNLLSGTNVFLGNFKEFFLHNQPYLFTREVIPYNKARALYKDWDRFQYVPKKVVTFQTTDTEAALYRDWSLLEVEQDMVEVIKYQDATLNEFQIMLNGVMMLPIEFPLTEISPSGNFTIAKGDCEPISRWFAISKSIPAKTKVDQGVLDEMLRLILLKMRKSFMPPMVNNTNKNLSRKVLFPGKITRDIPEGKFYAIGGENGGVTPSEMAVFQLLKNLIDEKTVSPVFSGDDQQGNATATQIIEQKKQQMMKLGLAIWGVVSLEKQLARLRLFNLLATWTKPIDQKVDKVRQQLVDVYRTVSLESTFEDGRKGTKIMEFNPTLSRYLADKGDVGSRMVEAEEEFLSKQGKPVRKVYLDPEALRNIEMNWYITITPTERETSELQRVLFIQTIKEAVMMFGPQSLNLEHIKHRYAILAGEDPDKLFVRTPPQQLGLPGGPQTGSMPQPGQMPQAMAGNTSQGIQRGVQGPMKPAQPSINKLAQA